MNEIHDAELYQRIEQNVRQQKAGIRWMAFGINAICFLLYLLLLFVSLSDPSSTIARIASESREIFIIPALMWLLVLSVHFGSALTDSGRADKQLMARAMTEELGQQIINETIRRASEKPKRDTAHLDDDYVTINDEGEMVSLKEAEGRSQTPAQTVGITSG